MAAHARLSEGGIVPDAELSRFLSGVSGAGAVVSFTGLARPTSKGGAAVAELFLDHYPGVTERSLQQIADDGAARFPVSDVAVVHRCGSMRPGETIVFVAAASLHRRAAFEAADYLMDRLKIEAVFWKRETGAEGVAWIEPTAADRADAGRWSR